MSVSRAIAEEIGVSIRRSSFASTAAVFVPVTANKRREDAECTVPSSKLKKLRRRSPYSHGVVRNLETKWQFRPATGGVLSVAISKRNRPPKGRPVSVFVAILLQTER